LNGQPISSEGIVNHDVFHLNPAVSRGELPTHSTIPQGDLLSNSQKLTVFNSTIPYSSCYFHPSGKKKTHIQKNLGNLQLHEEDMLPIFGVVRIRIKHHWDWSADEVAVDTCSNVGKVWKNIVTNTSGDLKNVQSGVTLVKCTKVYMYVKVR
jgi:hypothetical protein